MSGIEGLLAGRTLADRYRIEAVIGRGGMGAVYRATDERLGRAVAVKVITVSAGPDADARERLGARFLREARSAAALPHHPNVVPVYDYGTDEALGLDFLVMELLRGEDLATRLARSGPPPLTTGIWILHEAARGIAVGHRAGLIHRDVKPGNIFLARDGHGDEVQVRVLDFGIAKLAAEEDTVSQLTRDGRAPHSPAYASPEQLQGHSKLSPASDVFSLGAVGFQLLTGNRPFTDLDRNRMSIGMAVAAPSLHEQNPAVPTPVDEVVRRALAYDPAERWEDAGTLASMLEQARREMGDAPLPPYTPSVSVFTAARPSHPPPDADPDDRTQAEPPADRTEFLDDRTLLAPEPPPPRIPVASTSRRRHERERKRRGSGWIVGALAALVLLAAAGVFAWWTFGERSPATEAVAIAPEPVVDSVPTTEPVEEAVPTEADALINNLEGIRYYEAGDYPTALEQFRRALEIVPNNPEYRYNYALALLELGRNGEAADELERVIREDPSRPGAFYRLAEARLSLGDTAAAVPELERSRELSRDPREQRTAERRLGEIEEARRPPPLPYDTVIIRDPMAPPGSRP